jgi:uncharacterized protein YcbK (DUF882 family)
MPLLPRSVDRNPTRGTLVALALAIVAGVVAGADQLTAAFSDTRTISFYNIHTKETVTVLYKKKGRYVPDAMDQINWILRDWRKNEKTRMDPGTIDILWEMHTELGSKEPIHVISGYRSPGTNDMLRRTVGGQASNSQHTTGKAVDVSFPDVSIKQLRYAAMIRELGGVGYYPTSGIPFVHVDTGRVRHWPRMPRYELALLFPNGSSKHVPTDGEPITREDVKVAQSKHRDLAVQIAAYFDLRRAPRPADAGATGVLVADARPPPVPVPKPVAPAEPRVAALTPIVPSTPAATRAPPLAPSPVTAAAPSPARPKPQIVAEPKLVERPPMERLGRPAPRPTEADRSGLEALVELAGTPEVAPAPTLVQAPTPARRRPPTDISALFAEAAVPRTSWMQLAALDPADGPLMGTSATLTDAVPPGWNTGFAAAPAFDEEHPEELHYRPFPIAPLLTATASIDDPAIARLTAPDVVRIMQLLDEPTVAIPMQFRPGRQTAEVMWAQEFRGQKVQFSNPGMADGVEDELPTALIPRGVKTSPQR